MKNAIFAFFPPKPLAQLRRVDRNFRDLIDDHPMWRDLCEDTTWWDQESRRLKNEGNYRAAYAFYQNLPRYLEKQKQARIAEYYKSLRFQILNRFWKNNSEGSIWSIWTISGILALMIYVYLLSATGTLVNVPHALQLIAYGFPISYLFITFVGAGCFSCATFHQPVEGSDIDQILDALADRRFFRRTWVALACLSGTSFLIMMSIIMRFISNQPWNMVGIPMAINILPAVGLVGVFYGKYLALFFGAIYGGFIVGIFVGVFRDVTNVSDLRYALIPVLGLYMMWLFISLTLPNTLFGNYYIYGPIRLLTLISWILALISFIVMFLQDIGKLSTAFGIDTTMLLVALILYAIVAVMIRRSIDTDPPNGMDGSERRWTTRWAQLGILVAMVAVVLTMVSYFPNASSILTTIEFGVVALYLFVTFVICVK
eukprot:TRINITY_DN8528_c0_g1_i1.p1 TRINITY_DN8528_c0_g1~~TRINITY_DN8528_c0_g1_i1.p1  ORF type:complete len:439 (+),score=38.64 TRINITY_DN8528_c0_g1_i1:34-1317(+)